MQFKSVIKWGFVLAAYFAGAAANATPGGVDADGCHASAKIGHHCHPQRAKSGGSLPGDGTHAQRDKRLKRECKGRPNSGACLGYGG